MALSWICLVGLCCLALSGATSVVYVDRDYDETSPLLQIYVTQRGFDRIAQKFETIFAKNSDPLGLANTIKSNIASDLEYGKTEIHDPVLVEVNPFSVNLDLYPPSGLRLILDEGLVVSSTEFNFGYSTGKAIVRVADIRIEAVFLFGRDPFGNFITTAESCKASLTTTISFEGSHPLIRLLNQMAEGFVHPFDKIFTDAVCGGLTKGFAEGLAEGMGLSTNAVQPLKEPFNVYGLFVSLTDDPTVTEEYLRLDVNGTVVELKNLRTAGLPHRRLPVPSDIPSRDFHFVASQNIINSIFDLDREIGVLNLTLNDRVDPNNVIRNYFKLTCDPYAEPITPGGSRCIGDVLKNVASRYPYESVKVWFNCLTKHFSYTSDGANVIGVAAIHFSIDSYPPVRLLDLIVGYTADLTFTKENVPGQATTFGQTVLDLTDVQVLDLKRYSDLITYSDLYRFRRAVPGFGPFISSVTGHMIDYLFESFSLEEEGEVTNAQCSFKDGAAIFSADLFLANVH